MEEKYFIGKNVIIIGDVKINDGVKIWHFCHISNSTIGRNTKIGSFCELKGGKKEDEKIIMGDYCRIQSFVSIPEGTEIGNYVFIGPKTVILNDKYPNARDAFNKTWKRDNVVIEDEAVIGGNVTILPGIKIGKGAFIGAGSNVTKDVEPNAIVCGNPARVIGHTNNGKYKKNINKQTVSKALILAGGKGTRIRNLTSGTSKEMLMLNNIPVIEYSIKEAQGAGCSEIYVVIDKNKEDLENYLNKKKAEGFPITILYQKFPGLMGAIISAENQIGDDAFAMILPDMLSFEEESALAKVISAFNESNKATLCIFEESESFGKGKYLETEHIEKNLYKINSLDGDPKNKLRVFGRYAFPKYTFKLIKNIPLEDSEAALLKIFIKQQDLNGICLRKNIFDVGIPDGYKLTRDFLENNSQHVE